jgi:hypothetical protein
MGSIVASVKIFPEDIIIDKEELKEAVHYNPASSTTFDFRNGGGNMGSKSITRDNGLENKYHKMTAVPSYFCDPYSSWQKPHVENIIKLLRRFFKKGSDLSRYSDGEITFDVMTAIVIICFSSPKL